MFPLFLPKLPSACFIPVLNDIHSEISPFFVDLCQPVFISGIANSLGMSGTWASCTDFRFLSHNIYSTCTLNFSQDKSLNDQIRILSHYRSKGGKEVNKEERESYSVEKCPAVFKTW